MNNRREFIAALAALGVAGKVEAQTTGEGTLGKSKVFAPDFKKLPNGSERWGVLGGTLNTGEHVGMHVSIVPAGTPPSAPHKILHSELLVVAEGNLELFADGETSPAPTGSVIYVASGTTHAIRNVGTTAAKYFVWQMGGDTK
jgi:quercetin dioxygenase-like cupin family protein